MRVCPLLAKEETNPHTQKQSVQKNLLKNSVSCSEPTFASNGIMLLLKQKKKKNVSFMRKRDVIVVSVVCFYITRPYKRYNVATFYFIMLVMNGWIAVMRNTL